MSNKGLSGKNAIVTGAASGLGFAIAQRLLKDGMQVLITDINEEEGQTAAAEYGEQARFLRHDVASEADWSRVLEVASEWFGRLDVLVNNAGVTLMGDVESISLDAWDQTMGINLRGPFLGCRGAIPLMKEHGGSIVNIASVSSFKPQPELVAYNASKAGVALMTKSIALYCGQQGYNIRVNSIHPGVIQTPMLEKVINQVEEGEALMQSYRDMHPIGRIGKPSEISAMVAYLVSEEAEFITGSEFRVDGGLGIN